MRCIVPPDDPRTRLDIKMASHQRLWNSAQDPYLQNSMGSSASSGGRAKDRSAWRERWKMSLILLKKQSPIQHRREDIIEWTLSLLAVVHFTAKRLFFPHVCHLMTIDRAFYFISCMFSATKCAVNLFQSSTHWFILFCLSFGESFCICFICGPEISRA